MPKIMRDLKWRYCPCCLKLDQQEGWTCPICGNPLQAGRITHEEKPVDPRVQGPVANRETKKL